MLPIPKASQWPFDWPAQHAEPVAIEPEPERPQGKPGDPALLRVAPLPSGGGLRPQQRAQSGLLEAGLPAAFVAGFRHGLDPYSARAVEVEQADGHDRLLLYLGQHCVAVAGVDLLTTSPTPDQYTLGMSKGTALRHKAQAA